MTRGKETRIRPSSSESASRHPRGLPRMRPRRHPIPTLPRTHADRTSRARSIAPSREPRVRPGKAALVPDQLPAGGDSTGRGSTGSASPPRAALFRDLPRRTARPRGPVLRPPEEGRSPLTYSTEPARPFVRDRSETGRSSAPYPRALGSARTPRGPDRPPVALKERAARPEIVRAPGCQISPDLTPGSVPLPPVPGGWAGGATPVRSSAVSTPARAPAREGTPSGGPAPPGSPGRRPPAPVGRTRRRPRAIHRRSVR